MRAATGFTRRCLAAAALACCIVLGGDAKFLGGTGNAESDIASLPGSGVAAYLVPVHRVGNRYAVDFAFGSQEKRAANVLLDTSSVELILLRPPYETDPLTTSDSGTQTYEVSLNLDLVSITFRDTRIREDTVGLYSLHYVDQSQLGGSDAFADQVLAMQGTLITPPVTSNVRLLDSESLEVPEDGMEGLHTWTGVSGVIGLANVPSNAFAVMTADLDGPSTQRRKLRRQGTAAASLRMPSRGGVDGGVVVESVDRALQEASGSGDSTTPDAPRIVALDLRRAFTNMTSSMHIGGVSPEFIDRLQWSERTTYGVNLPWDISVFGLEVCGVDAFGGLSSNVVLQLDSTAVCTVFPGELFDSIVSWLPVVCDLNVQAAPSGTVTPPCVVDLHAAELTRLPSLKYRLSEGGEELFMPFLDLVVPDPREEPNAAEYRLCMFRGAARFDSTDTLVSDDATSKLVIGSMWMRTVYTVFDYENTRMAFAQQDGVLVTDAKCNAPVSCHASQTWAAATNSCRDPDCRQYLFQHLDEADGTCRYRPGWLALGFVLLFFAACWQCGNFCLAAQASTRIVQVHEAGENAKALRERQRRRGNGFRDYIKAATAHTLPGRDAVRRIIPQSQ